jgi:outer membrane protein TolC
MRFASHKIRLATYAVGALALAVSVADAQTSQEPTYPIDLPTALHLAGAQNLDIEMARQALKQAEANQETAVEQFLPWLETGIYYHRRGGLAQQVPPGTISGANFESYAPGATVSTHVALGEAIYNALAAKQLVRASDQALEAQREDSMLAAAQGYFDLAKAKALVTVAEQAVQTSSDYQQQLHQAVELGIAFKGDELRVQTQTEGYRIGVRRALEGQRVAAAKLAETLHLDPAVELVPQEGDLMPLTLVEPSESSDSLVKRAQLSRPELQQSQALISAARQGRNGARYGPLVPSIGAVAFAGGLGGGADGGPSNFGGMQDYAIGVSWRVGPGGLFDFGRIDASEAKAATAELAEVKLIDAITAQVVESLTRVRSLSEQIELAKRNLAAASETLRLTRERKRYGVGIVLEDIQAVQALNQAQADYVTISAEFNKAQYGLERAVGGL